jgi:hypothetical protein
MISKGGYLFFMTNEYPPSPPVPPTSLPSVDDFNGWADFYFYERGVNVIPAPTQNKGKKQEEWKTPGWVKDGWLDFQHRAMTEDEHKTFKENGDYLSRGGLAIVVGRVWRGPNKGQWLFFADGDNELAIDFWLKAFGYETLQEMAKDFVVEQHKDALHKVHIYGYTKVPLSNYSGFSSRKQEIIENKVPGVELKCKSSGLAFASPSYHVDGERYMIIDGGTPIPRKTLEEYQVAEIEDRIEDLIHDYDGVSYVNGDNGKVPISTLLQPDYRKHEGNNRPNDIIRIGMHYLLKEKDEWVALEKTREWNAIHCVPPLSEEKYIEFPRTWECAKKYVQRIKEKEGRGEEEEESKESRKEKNISLASKLIEEQEITWFHDEYDIGYARIKKETLRNIQSRSKRQKVQALLNKDVL